MFEGRAWHFLYLEIDAPETGDDRTSMIGTMPVVVTRAEEATSSRSKIVVPIVTFRITRLSQWDGVMVSDNGVAHASTTLAAATGPDDSYAGLRADNQGFRLEDPSFMNAVAEFIDSIAFSRGV